MVFVSPAPSNKFHFYFFYFSFPKMYVFFFFKVNLLVGANACVSREKWVYEWRLKTCQKRVVKKVILFIALSFTFWKMRQPVYSKVCTMESSWKWDFPTFQCLHFPSNIALSKNLELYFISCNSHFITSLIFSILLKIAIWLFNTTNNNALIE